VTVSLKDAPIPTLADNPRKAGGNLLWHGLAILAIVALLVVMVNGMSASRNRPLKIIVPFGAGGGSDTFVRMMQKAITEEKLTDQPLVIINQKGGSGTIGSRTVMTAPADGFTILNLHDGIITAKLSGKVPYGPEAFEPIAATGQFSVTVVVRADSKYKSLNQLLADAKAKPDTIGFGANVGAPGHFAGLLLERAVEGAKFRTIQSGGGQQRYTLLIGGHLEMGVFSLEEFVNYRSDGKIRALAILDAEPNSAVPDVPTAKQQGINVVHHLSQYWWAPKGTPAEKIDAIADILEKGMQSEQVRLQMERTNTEPLFVRGDPLKKLIAHRVKTLGQVDLGHKTDLPNFPLIVGCIIGGLMVLVIVFQIIERKKDKAISTDAAEPAATPQGSESIPTRQKLAWAVAGATLLYVLLLQFRVIRFAIVTALFVMIIGLLLSAGRPRKPWLALGEIALLCGLGLEFVFTRILVIDLP